MVIIATFRHSAYLELALKLLEEKGVSKGSILAAPLDQKPRDEMNEIGIVHHDGKSPYDVAFILAMVFMLLGGIYGFVLAWGPIIWAMIGVAVGAIAGLLLDVSMGKHPFRSRRKNASEVVLLISCDEQMSHTVEKILWTHQAFGVSKVKNHAKGQ